MKIYFFIFIALYSYFYISNFYNMYKKFKQFNYLLEKFNNVGNSLPERQSYMPYPLEEEYYREANNLILNELIHETPLINYLLPYNYDEFSWNDNGHATLVKFSKFYDQLQKANYDFEFTKLSYLNPIKPIKQIFLIPSKILSWFGLNLNTIHGRIVSALSWFCLYLFKSNTSEILIKGLDFIKSLLS